MRSQLTVFIIISLLFWTCGKDQFTSSPDALLSTSADSLHFDTLFSSTGSVTQSFRIYNPNNKKLLLNQVRLGGGAGSPFRMNVDGLSGSAVSDIEVEANDSIYVFVTVSIDPSSGDLPFVVEDSILIDYNGNEQKVYLDAWGQNAVFLRGAVIRSDQTWTNTKPYVILDGLLVDSNATLTIDKGCKIYLHADAPFVVDGTLKIFGEAFDSTRVEFRGDRLDDPYRDFPAGWPGIYFREGSKDNVLHYVNIRNAYQGLVATGPSTNGNPKLDLYECIIDNCYDAGLLGLETRIRAENCLLSNCGKNLLLAYGGDYDFLHCTAVSYSNPYLPHKDPVLQLADYIKDGNTILTAPLNARFRNCIFWGDNGTVDDEVVTAKLGTGSFIADFQNCLWKIKNEPANTSSSGIIANEYPSFDSVNTQRRLFNFRLRGDSPALDKGSPSSLSIDLDGHPRPVGLPDIGCYERQ